MVLYAIPSSSSTAWIAVSKRRHSNEEAEEEEVSDFETRLLECGSSLNERRND